MKSTRPYEMRARADAAAQTRERIMAAAIELANEKPINALVLPDVATRAEVSVQTVLRLFGSRDGLLDAATESALESVRAERDVAPGDVAAAVGTLFDHYEVRGDGVLLLLGQERWEPRAAEITSAGRLLHREWVEGVFAPFLARDGERDATVDLLVAASDVYTWKLWRRDRCLSRPDAEARMLRLIGNILEGI
ncbi:TetR/AcrR family transcriptional regulator [Lacisediminihabitans profunda]|nr:TetR/AcrR family transcriptional regulator [Lacisediminihabitans profunda]